MVDQAAVNRHLTELVSLLAARLAVEGALTQVLVQRLAERGIVGEDIIDDIRRSAAKANIAPQLEIPTLDAINERIRLLEGVFERAKGKG